MSKLHDSSKFKCTKSECVTKTPNDPELGDHAIFKPAQLKMKIYEVYIFRTNHENKSRRFSVIKSQREKKRTVLIPQATTGYASEKRNTVATPT